MKLTVFTLVSTNRKLALDNYDIKGVEEVSAGTTRIVFNSYNEVSECWSSHGRIVHGTFEQILGIVNRPSLQIFVDAGTNKRKALRLCFMYMLEQVSEQVTTIKWRQPVGEHVKWRELSVVGSFDEVMKQLESV
jgi:hypothetical protein